MAKYSYTINTDASFDNVSQKAGWAYWVACTHFRIKDSGLVQKTQNSSTAEMIAFIEAVKAVNKQVDPSGERPHQRKQVLIYVNTDSMWVIHAMTGIVNPKNTSEEGRRLMKEARKLTEGYSLDFRHVRSHQHTRTARNWVNDWCDKQARQQLRTALGVKKINNIERLEAAKRGQDDYNPES